MEQKKKPFKETKVGQLLQGLAGTVLPDKGLLGVVKNLIDDDQELTDEQKIIAHQQLTEMYKLEVEDRDSARNRQIEVSKTRKFDLLFNLTGIVGLGSFIFAIYAIVYVPSTKGNDLFVHLLGLLEGVVVSNIFAYYFGTSIDKDKN